MLRTRRNGDRPAARVWLRLGQAAGALLLLAAIGWTVAAQTIPEFILYQDRARLNILKFESRLDLQPIDLKTVDGLTLRSYFYPPEEGRPVIVYFPDRVGDIIHKPKHLTAFAEEGYGLLLSGYRGYGGNPGTPSEGLLYADATALLMKVKEEQLAPDGLIVYGYSMGTGIASYVASTMETLGLVLEAPFTSFADAVRQQVQQVPSFLVRTKFDTRSRMAGIDVPILLLAGDKDQITPARFARDLASLNANHASLVVLPGGNHLNLIRHGGSEAVQNFLTRLKLPIDRAMADAAEKMVPAMTPATTAN